MVLTQYIDRYIYDKGLNLTNIYHNQGVPQVQGARLDSNRLSQLNYDDAGNQLGTENLDKIEYNFEGQMASTRKTTENIVANEYYTYGAPGHRVKKVTETISNDKVIKVDIVLYVGGTEYRTCYTGVDLLYDGDVVIEKSGGAATIAQDDVTARIQPEHGQIGKVTTDHQSQNVSYSYNIINNIDSNLIEIDSAANIISYQSFYPYGGVASTWGNIGNKQIGYSGQEKDSTQFIYYGFRYYYPLIGRWTRPDPIGFQGGQLNLYAMVGNNPITFRDEKGSMKISHFIMAYFRDMRDETKKNNVPEEIVNTVTKNFTTKAMSSFNMFKEIAPEGAVSLEHFITSVNKMKNLNDLYYLATKLGSHRTEFYKKNIESIENSIFKKTVKKIYKNASKLKHVFSVKTMIMNVSTSDWKISIQSSKGFSDYKKIMSKDVDKHNIRFIRHSYHSKQLPQAKLSFCIYDKTNLAKMFKLIHSDKKFDFVNAFKLVSVSGLHVKRETMLIYLYANQVNVSSLKRIHSAFQYAKSEGVEFSEDGDRRPLLMIPFFEQGVYFLNHLQGKSLVNQIYRNLIDNKRIGRKTNINRATDILRVQRLVDRYKATFFQALTDSDNLVHSVKK